MVKLTFCFKSVELKDLRHFVWDAVVEQPSEAQEDSELVELRWGLRMDVDAAEVFLHVGRRHLRLQVYVAVGLPRQRGGNN